MKILVKSMLFFLVLLVNSSRGEDWVQYRGFQGDGKTSERIGRISWPSEGPKQLWKVETPTGFSSFSVADDRVFTLVGRENDAGEKIECCVALDATSGQELWFSELGGRDYGSGGGNAGAPDNNGGDGPRSSPACDNARVYVYDAHLVLYCFDAKSGTTLWKHDVPAEYGGQNISWKNAASPLLHGKLVYVFGGGPRQSFLAFHRISGELVWSSGNETMTHATPALATIHQTPQVIFFNQSGLVAVDDQTGEEYWHCPFPFRTSTAASPVVFRDLVYCSAGYGVGAGLFRIKKSGNGFEAENVWQQTNNLMNHWSTPICLDGRLYGIFGHKRYGKAPLQCVELETGEILWSQDGFGPGNCILVDDKLLVLTDDGRLVLVEANPTDYQELAHAKVLEGKCWSTPAFCNGRAYVRSTQEGVCIDLSL